MRAIVFALLAACGSDQKPLLNGVPQPPAGAVAGIAAAAAAAVTLANPNAPTPEKRDDRPKQEVEVKEHVTGDVLDRLDQAEAVSDPDVQPADTASAPRPAKKKARGKTAKIPTPAAAAAAVGPGTDSPDALPAR